MDKRQAVIGLVWLVIVVLTLNAVYRDGIAFIWRPFVDSATSLLVVNDLLVELTLICIWVYFDATRRGISPIPWIIVIAILGGVGTLGYLFLRAGDQSAGPIVNTTKQP